MKFATLICTLAIFGPVLAQVEQPRDPLEEARNRAFAATKVFISNYSTLSSDEAFFALNKKFSEIQSSLHTKNEEANQLIRTPYDEFYMSLSLGSESGNIVDCYHIAILNLMVDVYVKIWYDTPTVYSEVISELEMLSSGLLSDEFNTVMNRINTTIYDVNISIGGLDALTAQFETDAADVIVRGRQLLNAIETELEKLVHKFHDENNARVSQAMDKLATIKEDYENCKLKGD